jgi:hypothetical protein
MSLTPGLYSLDLSHHDKHEFAKLTKVSNYINTIEELIKKFSELKIWPYVNWGKTILERLKYILELRLGSDEHTFNNASILIGQTVTSILQHAHEYINNGLYYLNKGVLGQQFSKSSITEDEKYNLQRHGFVDTGDKISFPSFIGMTK